MTYPPGQYQPYPQHSGATQLSAERPVPSTVRNAFRLMLAGAALSALNPVVSVFQRSRLRQAAETALRNKPTQYTDVDVDHTVTFGLVAAVIGALITVGLWVWMAFANRSGKNWARITATVLFGISTLFTAVGFAVSSAVTTGSTASPISIALTAVGWLVGLATVILLWHNQSKPFFQPAPPVGYGYPPQPYPPQPYPPQAAPPYYPVPGQQAPMPANPYMPPPEPGPPATEQPRSPWAPPTDQA
jgi:hypothetical protein